MSAMWQEVLAYAAVFLAAATPWVEIIIVIPVAIGAGMHPVLVACVAFAGNAAPVALIVFAHRLVARWWQRRRHADTPGAPSRGWRARLSGRALHRYGIPGLALIAPLTTGIHVATLIALGLRGPRPPVLAWMIASLAAWSLITAALAAFGVSLFR